MFTTEEIKHLLLFPLKDGEARRKFLVAVSLTVAGFIIPVLPWLAMMGYAARLMRRIIDEGRPAEMPEWDSMAEMMVDGVRLIGFRLLVSLPFALIGFLLFGLVFTPSMLMELDPQRADAYGTFLGISMLIFVPLFLVIFLLSFPLAIALSAADAHVVTQKSIMAGFRVAEWWPILRKNLVGFVLIYIVIFALGAIISIPVTFAMMTIVLICLMPIFMVAYTPYATVVMYAFIAHAYAQGRNAILNDPITPE